MFLLLVGFVFLGCRSYQSIERVEVASALSPPSSGFRNILMIGTDNRDGIDDDNVNANAILGEDAPDGSRTDTILVLQLHDEGSKILSLPRDLWVTEATTGDAGRINAVYAEGPDELVRTVRESFDLPIHHYVEVDFAGFLDVVDALGGVTVDFPNPAFDTRSGLLIEEAGPNKLNSDEALAYVRSRQYTELVDGQQRRDPTGDLGRVSRQQAFLSQLFNDLAGVRNPITMQRVASTVGGAIKTDEDLNFFDAIAIARRVRGLDPEPAVLPTTPFRTEGGAAVLLVDDPAATPVLESFR